MKSIFLLSTLFMGATVFASGQSLVLQTGTYNGVSSDGENCSLTIAEDTTSSSIRYGIQFYLDGEEEGELFETSRVNHAIDNTVTDTGIYLSGERSTGFGSGAMQENLSLSISDDNTISDIFLTVQYGLFRVKERKYNCKLSRSFTYGVEDVIDQ